MNCGLLDIYRMVLVCKISHFYFNRAQKHLPNMRTYMDNFSGWIQSPIQRMWTEEKDFNYMWGLPYRVGAINGEHIVDFLREIIIATCLLSR